MKTSILFILLSFFMISCGGYNTGVTIKDHKGYLKFTGNTYDITVSINDNQPFMLQKEVEVYSLEPGTHNVKIYRDKNVVVNRTIIVDAEVTTEIEVP